MRGMTRRKGELTPAAIDRGWPHQVVLPQEAFQGKLNALQADFCDRNKLLRCARGHSVSHEDRHFNVNCFATKAGAEKFMQEFGGEWFDPTHGGRGINWNKWNKPS